MSERQPVTENPPSPITRAATALNDLYYRHMYSVKVSKFPKFRFQEMLTVKPFGGIGTIEYLGNVNDAWANFILPDSQEAVLVGNRMQKLRAALILVNFLELRDDGIPPEIQPILREAKRPQRDEFAFLTRFPFGLEIKNLLHRLEWPTARLAAFLIGDTAEDLYAYMRDDVTQKVLGAGASTNFIADVAMFLVLGDENVIQEITGAASHEKRIALQIAHWQKLTMLVKELGLARSAEDLIVKIASGDFMTRGEITVETMILAILKSPILDDITFADAQATTREIESPPPTKWSFDDLKEIITSITLSRRPELSFDETPDEIDFGTFAIELAKLVDRTGSDNLSREYSRIAGINNLGSWIYSKVRRSTSSDGLKEESIANMFS